MGWRRACAIAVMLCVASPAAADERPNPLAKQSPLTCAIGRMMREGRLETGAVLAYPGGRGMGVTYWVRDGLGPFVDHLELGGTSAGLRWVPARGKLLLFNSAVVRADIDLWAAATRAAGTITPSVGGSLNLFATDWLAVGIGARWTRLGPSLPRAIGFGEPAVEPEARGQLAATLSLSILWPTKPRHRCRCR